VEESHWSNDVKEGRSIEYFLSGKFKDESAWNKDERDG